MRLNYARCCFYAFLCLTLIHCIKADGEETLVQAATTTDTTNTKTNTSTNGDIDLESMTNEQLEEICTSRGFEVVKDKDEETGEMKTYTHDDYVNAATQCLEIESEMDEILGDNPELIQEIEAEAERMRQENTRLEQEIASMIEENGQAETIEDNTRGETKDDSDEVIDLDNDGAASNASDGASANSTEKTVGAPRSDLSPELSFGAVLREVRDKIMQDFHMVADLILPKSARGPLKLALKPVVNVVREATKTVGDMVHRYAGPFLDKFNNGNGEEAILENAVATK